MKQNYNHTVKTNDGRILTLTDFIKENAIYLIDRLENYKDNFSKELKITLKNSLGKKWSEGRNTK